MKTALTCAALATLLSFSSAWLLARLSMAALLLCLPRGQARTAGAERSRRPCA